MDPGLEEAILRTPPGAEIEAVALLRPGHPLPGALRIIATFGNIVTCRVPSGGVRAMRAHPAVESLKAARLVQSAMAYAVTSNAPIDARPVARRRGSDDAGGRGVIVGALDWGCDVAHPAFRRADGGTRLLALWDQRGSSTDPANPYGYGHIFDRARIDRALATSDPYGDLGYHPAIADPFGHGAHGSHVLSIAAGSTSAPAGAAGVAPAADLVFVHLATGILPETSHLGDSVRILEGIDFIRRLAGTAPWVINLSLGRTGGDHSGRSLVEMAMDFVVEEGPGHAISLSGGNYYDKTLHAQGIVEAGRAMTLEWRIPPDDPTTNELEIWYSGRDALRLELRPPNAREAIAIELGDRVAIESGERLIGRAYHRRLEPITHDNHIDIFLDPAAPPGAWHVTLIGRDVVDGRFHAWIERDSAVPGAQSHFAPEISSARSTIGTIATGYRTIVVGAADTRWGTPTIAPFCSAGPTRDGRVKPDLLAPGVAVVAARSTPAGGLPGSGGVTTYSGTSMAAPHVTGAIASLFSAAPRKLTASETRALLLGSADDVPGLDPERAGDGLLNLRAALAALRAVFNETRG